MKIELYSVKDNLVGFSQPFPCSSEAVAVRSFISSAKAIEPNVVNTYPEHKELYKVGDMDDQTGIITSDVRFIARAIDYIEVAHEKEEGETDVS